MEPVDIDVKLVVYSMLAQLDGGTSYSQYRKQADLMMSIAESDSDDDDETNSDTSDGDSFAEKNDVALNEEELASTNAMEDEDVYDMKEESDPEDSIEHEDVSMPLNTKGELQIDELPPVEHLSISPDVSVDQLGDVCYILDLIVVVKAYRFTPALDMDTILFLSDGRPIGPIFETFGQVVEPSYVIRFNSVNDIKNLGLAKKTPVCYAPHSAKYTKFVFVDRLRTVKGSDASWEDNNEPPIDCLDYSDDEEERRAKAAMHSQKAKNYYSKFLPPEKRIGLSTESAFDNGEEACDNSLSSSLFKQRESNVTTNLKNKLVGTALARARRKVARTNLADISSAQTSSSNNNVLSAVSDAVKMNPSLLPSIISSAMSAASGQPAPGAPSTMLPLVMPLPLMLPPTGESNSQPRFVPMPPCNIPPPMTLPQDQRPPAGTVRQSLEPRRRLVDSRFMKK